MNLQDNFEQHTPDA